MANSSKEASPTISPPLTKKVGVPSTFGALGLTTLLLAIFAPRLRGRSVLCLGHPAIEALRRPESNCRLVVARHSRELLGLVRAEIVVPIASPSSLFRL